MKNSAIDLDCDMSPNELPIAELVRASELNKESIQTIRFHLESILYGVFGSLEKDNSMRYWALDDFYIENVSQNKKKLTLGGQAHWLEGGIHCDLFQIDIAKDTMPLLYSYKFRKKSGNCAQVLYIGKTYQGWVINA